jgi:hypothetical protein
MAEPSASEARRIAPTAQGFNAPGGHAQGDAVQRCTVERLIEGLGPMASWLGLSSLAIAPVAAIDRPFATLHVEAHPACVEPAPAQSEMALYA